MSQTQCVWTCLHFLVIRSFTRKPQKKKNGTKGAFWICIELPLLCTLTKDNIGGILSTDHMIHFSKAGRNGTLNVKQKCTGANVVL